ncbi:MAG: FG-GAP repeat domain-containing protein [Planctomycetota bacterium]
MAARARLLRRTAPLWGLALLFAGAAPGHGRPPGPLRFERTDIDIGGRITEVITEDLDGDGRVDLLVTREREALVYFQGPDGAFKREAHQRFRFHPRTILFDVGDLDGDGKLEIVLLQADGAQAYSLRPVAGRLLYGLRPRRLVKCPSFFTRPVEDEVRRKPLLRDLDADGKLDLVIPQRDGFALLRNEGGGKLAAPVSMQAPPEAVLNVGWDRLSGQLFASYWFPNPVVAQFDAAGPPEVVLAREGTINVFGVPQGSPLPTEKRGSYTIPDQRQFSRMVENPLELDFTMPLQVLDVDGDGRCDVSSTHVGEGTTRLFKNSKDPAQAFAKPALTVRAKGVTFFSYYSDLDGDGRLDLILPRIDKVSVWGIVKVLLTRSLDVEMLAYYQRKDGSFPNEPDRARVVEVPVAINSKGDRLQFGTSLVVSIDGDYDGDGLKDLLLRDGDDVLAVYRGLPQRGREDDASATVEVPSVADYQFCLPMVRDLDGDERDDVVLRYWSWDHKGDRLVVLRSKGVR